MKPVGSLIAGMAIAFAALPASAHEAPASLEGLPLLADVAPDAVQISPHVPNMGAHWARTDDLPTGPIYCEIEGHVVCVEYICSRWRTSKPGPIGHH